MQTDAMDQKLKEQTPIISDNKLAGWRIDWIQRGPGPIQSLFTSDVRETAAEEMELDGQQK